MIHFINQFIDLHSTIDKFSGGNKPALNTVIGVISLRAGPFTKVPA